MKKNLLFLLIILLSISTTSYAATTWTGAGDGTSWEDPANWNSGVPDATDVVNLNVAATITGTATVAPLRVRVWDAVEVTLDLDLTVTATANGIQVIENGTLNLGNGVTSRTFTISTTGATSAGILLSKAGSNLVVAANSTVKVLDSFYGVSVINGTSTLTNNGTIEITDYRGEGIYQTDGTFNNNGIITINTPVAASTNGVDINGATAIFNNNAGGTITVADALIHQFSVTLGTANNSGTMTLTGDSGAGTSEHTLAVTGTFNNNNTGVVNAIAVASSARAIQVITNGTLDNSGKLNLSGGAATKRFFIQGTMTNTCGIIDMGDGRIWVTGTFTNDGLVKTTNTGGVTRPNSAGVSTNNGFVIANGTGWKDAASTGTGTDNGITSASSPVNVVVDALNTCGATDIGIDAIHNWYSDVAMTTLVGDNDIAGMLAIEDNAYTTSGPHTLYSCYGTDVTMTLSGLDGACLPVELMSFEGVRKEDNVELTWVTASEENNYGFEVERAYKNGAELEWEMIDFVEGAGTTYDVQTYSFDDVQPFRGTNYYRLKQLDFDGQFEYSNIVSVEFGVGAGIYEVKISPNPVRSQLVLEDGIGQVTIFNVLGQPVKNVQATDASYAISLADLPNGQYIIRVQKEDGTIGVQQFLKID